MSPNNFFSDAEKMQIVAAIGEAETNTSGEIRLHVEGRCKADVLDRAAYVFEKLGMHKTDLRNGVLFYLALTDHKFAIIGDAGINAKVPANFWDEINNTVLSHFKEGKYAEGLALGVKMAGDELKADFPYHRDDVNELSDDISFGKK